MRIRPLSLILFLVPAGFSTGGDFILFEEDSVSVGVGSYRTVSFTLQEYQSDSASIRGVLFVEPDTTELEFLLFHLDDYNRWNVSDPEVDTLGYSATGSGPLSIDVPAFGWLVLVISNRGNYHPAVLACSLAVDYTGSGLPEDPLPDALRIALVLMMAGAVIIAVGGVLAGMLSGRGKRRVDNRVD